MSAPADAAGKNVKLTAASGVDLAAHVGHTVEVTGGWAKSGDCSFGGQPVGLRRPDGEGIHGEERQDGVVDLLGGYQLTKLVNVVPRDW